MVDRYAAELMSEIRGAAGALLAASATISDSEELTATAAYMTAPGQNRLQRYSNASTACVRRRRGQRRRYAAVIPVRAPAFSFRILHIR